MVAVAAVLVMSSCATGGAEFGAAGLSPSGMAPPRGVVGERAVAPGVPESSVPVVDVVSQPLVFPSDGVTAMARGLGGGSYVSGIPITAIAGSADIGLWATVVDIQPTILNTLSGEWDPPAGLSPSDLHDRWGSFAPYTVVAMRVDEVLGVRSTFPEIKVGDVIEVWFAGGSKIVTVSKAQALAIGMEGDVDPAAEDKAAAEGSVAEPAEVTGDLIRTIQMAHSLYFEEGDSLVFFGRVAERVFNTPVVSAGPVLWSLISTGAGVFVSSPSGRVTDAGTGVDVDKDVLLDIARSLGEATGPSQPVSAGQG